MDIRTCLIATWYERFYALVGSIGQICPPVLCSALVGVVKQFGTISLHVVLRRQCRVMCLPRIHPATIATFLAKIGENGIKRLESAGAYCAV